jgi:hypothetical protein
MRFAEAKGGSFPAETRYGRFRDAPPVRFWEGTGLAFLNVSGESPDAARHCRRYPTTIPGIIPAALPPSIGIAAPVM